MLKRGLILLVSLGVVTAAAVMAPSEDRNDALPKYRVVPNWPTLPDGLVLGETTGVAIDAKDLIYVLHRGKKRPLLVFDQKGKFLRSWGDGLIKVAHGLKIAPDGKVWVTDIGHHLVFKFGPQGKLLMTLGTKGKPGRAKRSSTSPRTLPWMQRAICTSPTGTETIGL